VTDVNETTKATDNTLPKTKIQAKTDISPIKIEQKDLEKLLRQVNPNKASGPDTYALGFYW
jgi:hypothetical protein